MLFISFETFTEYKDGVQNKVKRSETRTSQHWPSLKTRFLHEHKVQPETFKLSNQQRCDEARPAELQAPDGLDWEQLELWAVKHRGGLIIMREGCWESMFVWNLDDQRTTGRYSF